MLVTAGWASWQAALRSIVQQTTINKPHLPGGTLSWFVEGQLLFLHQQQPVVQGLSLPQLGLAGGRTAKRAAAPHGVLHAVQPMLQSMLQQHLTPWGASVGRGLMDHLVPACLLLLPLAQVWTGCHSGWGTCSARICYSR